MTRDEVIELHNEVQDRPHRLGACHKRILDALWELRRLMTTPGMLQAVHVPDPGGVVRATNESRKGVWMRWAVSMELDQEIFNLRESHAYALVTALERLGRKGSKTRVIGGSYSVRRVE